MGDKNFKLFDAHMRRLTRSPWVQAMTQTYHKTPFDYHNQSNTDWLSKESLETHISVKSESNTTNIIRESPFEHELYKKVGHFVPVSVC